MRTILVLFLVASSAYGEVIHVPADYPSIQQAINFAAKGDEIVVGPGTYNENINFLGQAIHVRGSAEPQATIIDGGVEPAVTFASGENRESVLDGFTITSGEYGLRIFNQSSATIANCIFSDNGLSLGSGAAIWNTASNPRIVDCLFKFNIGAAIGNFGGDPAIERCVFRNNEGSAIATSVGDPVIVNCLFYDNIGIVGASIQVNSGRPTITNCTFVHNEASLAGGGINVQGSSSVAVENSIFWINFPNQIQGGGVTLSHSDVHGGWEGLGENNINANPRFVDFEACDFRLLPDSPCIDKGDNAAVQEDVTADLDGNPRVVDGDDDGKATVDMGAYELQACMADFDGDGAVRVPDLIILLGSWGLNPGHPADLDGDGEVRVPDLIILLAAWGTCK